MADLKHVYWDMAFFFVMKGNSEENGYTAISRNDGSRMHRTKIGGSIPLNSTDYVSFRKMVRLIWSPRIIE
jgi:hypothetical protein